MKENILNKLPPKPITSAPEYMHSFNDILSFVVAGVTEENPTTEIGLCDISKKTFFPINFINRTLEFWINQGVLTLLSIPRSGKCRKYGINFEILKDWK